MSDDDGCLDDIGKTTPAPSEALFEETIFGQRSTAQAASERTSGEHLQGSRRSGHPTVVLWKAQTESPIGMRYNRRWLRPLEMQMTRGGGGGGGTGRKRGFPWDS